ncbi:hypothetical protein FV242_26945 [Methylobacterium sp. WL64]|uniref:hypothetical protein n=1 Tax=Methylobacterium sp. WL64 TaxID=2603894 RepID=UPI0011C92E4F|nr:hypothetical protein [Methylobacterium sp. WL64]TXM99041.1 hypothetical protein FV242_26945 [Methylobacterium sp. WL64]
MIIPTTAGNRHEVGATDIRDHRDVVTFGSLGRVYQTGSEPPIDATSTLPARVPSPPPLMIL